MTDRLGAYIAEKREEIGLNQTELADRAGVPRQTINRLEKGVTKLPGALVRRQIAHGLGVRHIDILVAAGEITAEEADLTIDPRSAAVRRLANTIDQYTWSKGTMDMAEQLIRTIGESHGGKVNAPVIEEE